MTTTIDDMSKDELIQAIQKHEKNLRDAKRELDIYDGMSIKDYEIRKQKKNKEKIARETQKAKYKKDLKKWREDKLDYAKEIEDRIKDLQRTLVSLNKSQTRTGKVIETGKALLHRGTFHWFESAPRSDPDLKKKDPGKKPVMQFSNISFLW